jgi:hypothetical protein
VPRRDRAKASELKGQLERRGFLVTEIVPQNLPSRRTINLIDPEE